MLVEEADLEGLRLLAAGDAVELGVGLAIRGRGARDDLALGLEVDRTQDELDVVGDLVALGRRDLVEDVGVVNVELAGGLLGRAVARPLGDDRARLLVDDLQARAPHVLVRVAVELLDVEVHRAVGDGVLLGSIVEKDLLLVRAGDGRNERHRDGERGHDLKVSSELLHWWCLSSVPGGETAPRPDAASRSCP